MIQRDINVLSALTPEYNYKHMSLENVSTTVHTYSHFGYSTMPPVSLQLGIKYVELLQIILTNVSPQNLYWCCPLLSRYSA